MSTKRYIVTVLERLERRAWPHWKINVAFRVLQARIADEARQ
jgi:hypothetical protein